MITLQIILRKLKLSDEFVTEQLLLRLFIQSDTVVIRVFN